MNKPPIHLGYSRNFHPRNRNLNTRPHQLSQPGPSLFCVDFYPPSDPPRTGASPHLQHSYLALYRYVNLRLVLPSNACSSLSASTNQLLLPCLVLSRSRHLPTSDDDKFTSSHFAKLSTFSAALDLAPLSQNARNHEKSSERQWNPPVPSGLQQPVFTRTSCLKMLS